MNSSSESTKRSGVIMALCTGLLLITAACGSGDGGGEGTPDAAPSDVADVSGDIEDDADGSMSDGGDATDVEDVPSCEPEEEQCNGEDDDCDDIADEGCACNYEENDTGVCSEGTIGEANGECQPPENYEDEESSCDDVDNDCDGITDEGCPCPYDGKMTGICKNGTKSPEDGSCQAPDAYISGIEDGFQNMDHCDGVDNDCNGAVDEGCPCNFANIEKGVCGETTRGYIDGKCQKPSSYQNDESICDGRDNDCNGEIDESCTCVVGETQSCYTGPSGTADVGACSSGQQTCEKDGDDSSFGECTNQTLPSGENCTDGIDNDCDGDTDMADSDCSCMPGATQSCYTGPSGTQGVGICADGEQTCQQNADGSSWGACTNQTLPKGENCTDGVDNDCDGDTDMNDSACTCNPGATQSCYTGPSGTRGVGICADGEQTCQQENDGSAWGSCTNQTFPQGENCTDGIDNDCDGDTDMNDSVCSCTIGSTRSCYTGPSGTKGVGQCSAGTETCQQANAGTKWGSCKNETLPSIEACGDSIDNDCDGQTDESGSVFEDFEGSDTGWSQFNNGSGTVNTSTSASTAYNGSEAAKAEGPNQGVCGVGGISKSFNFTQVPTSMTVWVKATTNNWGRVSILVQDSTGITPIWVNKGSGTAINMSWTKKTFDPSQYTSESNFTLIFGNNDNSSFCGNFDHDWTLWIDDLEITQPSCSSP